MVKKFLFFSLLVILPLIGKGQTSPLAMADFTKFVSKNYRLPDSLKSNCDWMYAIVKVKTNKANKVVDYDFINTPSEEIKKGFNFLKGDKFPQKTKINGRPIVFYFSIDNAQICNPKEGGKQFYNPNQVVGIITSHYRKILRDTPNAIIIPNLIMQVFYPQQQ